MPDPPVGDFVDRLMEAKEPQYRAYREAVHAVTRVAYVDSGFQGVDSWK